MTPENRAYLVGCVCASLLASHSTVWGVPGRYQPCLDTHRHEIADVLDVEAPKRRESDDGFAVAAVYVEDRVNDLAVAVSELERPL